MNRIYTLLFLYLLGNAAPVRAQDSIIARLIMIGDAGETDTAQARVIPHAASQVLPGKTKVIYLGDNIYPRGMGLTPGSKEETKTQDIMRSQYEPMRKKGAPVYFIPGNHDWDRMGPKGLAKIKRQWEFLESQNDPGLKLVPPNGCPDPVAIPLSDSSVIIAFDSEWWLFPFDKTNEGADCSCETPTDVVRSIQELLYRNRYKTVILAMHHPFQSYGTHGGNFSVKDHIFPLTAFKPNLYIPLPGIGSIYPLFRRTFTNPEDLHHPLYKDMIRNVDAVFKGFPNLVHISGHEHGLQLIRNTTDSTLQIVSGGGAKSNYTIKGKHSLYGKAGQGYVTADVLPGNHIRFTFYQYENGSIHETFQYEWVHTPYQPREQVSYQQITGDSITAAAHPAYQNDGKFYQFVFGKNYRQEWSTPATLPVIRISELHGGLKPTKLGGGFQSTSLRLKDAQGREWALRTVEKKPDMVVPVAFQGTFVRELLDDATSAQHPYSALMVPPIAKALGVPHATPIIGMVAPDSSLGLYQKLFEGRITLLEQREPLGKSDNFTDALKDLQKDNDNSYDAQNFLKARMIDVLFGDWDRHGDQWRFYNTRPKGEDKFFIAIPRDRDMVLNTTEGVLPTLIKRLFVFPRVYGFMRPVGPGAKYYLYKSTFLNAHPASQLNDTTWARLAAEFKTSVTDEVLTASLHSMPREIDSIRHQRLLQQLKARRDGLPAAMEKYYRFSNQIVDVRTSNKNELIIAEDMPGHNGTLLTIRKIDKHGRPQDTLAHKAYPRSITREIRLYTGKGDDSVVVNTQHSTVKLRIIGGKGQKAYHIEHSRKRIKLYDREPAHYYGHSGMLHKHLKDDSVQTAFEPVNLYNTVMPLVSASINPDDGLSLGLGAQFTRQKGFRQHPFSSRQSVVLSHSFTTQAFNIKYRGEWVNAIGHANLYALANIKAPDNTQNYFGRGNETEFDKTGNFKRYYRARFNIIDLSAGLRWRGAKGSELSVGPALEFYRYDTEENEGRFITHTDQIGSYDSAFVDKDKLHGGIALRYTLDQRNDKVLPTWGVYVNIDVQAMTGFNSYSRSFIRIVPEVALYKSLNAKRTLVLTDRIGGGLSFGQTAFYQAIYLGSQGNLYGYRLYRFAGQQALYNNLELRLALATFGNYIFKGQLGVSMFYDVGRVWQPGEESHLWHNGVGAGVYLAPASLVVFRFNMAYSAEGWYPNFNMGFRF